MHQDRTLDELGPVDYLIIEFPPGHQNFQGEIAEELVRLHTSGAVRVMDVVIIVKNADGSFEAHELSDFANLDAIEQIEEQLAETLAADDVATLAAAMAPGSIAGVLIYENLWAAPFASAVRRAGGQLVSGGRIPIQALIAAVDADEAAGIGAESAELSQVGG
jgi:hypothetical protein